MKRKFAGLIVLILATAGILLPAEAQNIDIRDWIGEGVFIQVAELMDAGYFFEAYELLEEIGPDYDKRLYQRALKTKADILVMFFDMPEKAIELYLAAEKVQPGTEIAAQSLRQAAITLHQQGKLAKAKKVYETIIARYSSHPALKSEAEVLRDFLTQEIALKGAEIAPPPPPELKVPPYIRVAIATQASSVSVNAPYQLRVSTSSRSYTIKAPITIEKSGSSLVCPELNLSSDTLLVEPQGTINTQGIEVRGLYISIGGRSPRAYRGSLYLSARGRGILVVNRVGLEEYLYGVINSEMPVSFGLEALKVQAVAARTYVLYKIYHESKKDYDVLSTIRDQVYSGVSRETRAGRKAVDATRGMILIYGKRPILAYFSASNGKVIGHPSEISKDFEGGFSYFNRGRDPLDGFPAWTAHATRSKLERSLMAKGSDVGRITSMAISKRTASGRAKRIRIAGTKGNIELPATRFKYLLGNVSYDRSSLNLKPQLLLSYLITSIDVSGDEVIIRGRGFGHGVGMSQYGTKDRAKRGHNFKSILGFYYPKAKLVKMD